MKITVNEGAIDRYLRGVLGSLLIAAGIFWLAAAMQLAALIVGGLLVLTGLSGFCPLYLLLKINTGSSAGRSVALLPFVLIVTLAVASFASITVTRKQYLENFNVMNGDYKQALFQTGQQNRDEAVKYYDRLQISFADFSQQYQVYRPYALWGDEQFGPDLQKVQAIIAAANDNVHGGDLSLAHTQLEQVRPVFQDIFKRNGFSMVSIALVDFHDVMEKLIDASDQKDAARIIAEYGEADKLLKTVEAEINDGDIQTIRGNLEKLLKLAQDGRLDDLSSQAGELKKSFVKVYLIRG